MTIADIPGLGRFELDWRTMEYPTPDPGGDPWLVQIDSVWWLIESSLCDVYVTVSDHALWHKMPDGRCLSEHLEQWVYDHEEPEYSDDEAWYDVNIGFYEDEDWGDAS